MKQIPLPVTIRLSVRVPLALLQPEPDAPKSHARPGCGACGKCQHEEERC